MDETVRWINLVSGAILMAVLIVAMAATWRITQPSGRLLGFGLFGYFLYGVGSSHLALVNHIEVSWVAVVLPVANVWLVGAIIMVTLEKRHEALDLANLLRHDQDRDASS